MQMKDQQVRGDEALLPSLHLPWKARQSPHRKLWDRQQYLVKPFHPEQYSPKLLAWREWWMTSTRNKEVAESTERMTGARKQIIHMWICFLKAEEKIVWETGPWCKTWLKGKPAAHEKSLQPVPALLGRGAAAKRQVPFWPNSSCNKFLPRLHLYLTTPKQTGGF